MNSKLKQILTLLLSVCVVFAFSSVAAFADGEEPAESEDVNVYYDKNGSETILGMFRVMADSSSVTLNKDGSLKVMITNKPLSRIYNKIALVAGDKTDEEKNAAAIDGIVKEVGEGSYQTTFSFDIDPSQVEKPIYVSFLSTSKGETSWGTNATYRIKVHGNGSSKLKAQLDAAQKAAKAKADKEKADKAAKAKANRIKTEQNKIKNIALAKVKVKKGKKKITVKWKKNTKFAGYQIMVVEQKTMKPVKTLKVSVKAKKNVIKGLKKIEHKKGSYYVYNIGTGVGYSVLDIVKAYEKVNNITIPYVIAPRRAGDLPEYYADSSKAQKELNWHTEKTLEDMCRDCYRFVLNCK